MSARVTSVVVFGLLVCVVISVSAQTVHWSPRSGRLVEGATTISAGDDGLLIASGRLGFWISTDQGQSWQHRLDSVEIHGGVLAIGHTLIRLNKDIARSTDRGVTWSTVQTLRNGASITLADTIGDMLLYDGLLILSSTDFGRSWRTDTATTAVAPWRFGPSRLVWAYSAGRFYVSSNFGLTWQSKGKRAPSTWDSFGYYYARSQDSIFVSTDSGATWQYRSTAPPGSLHALPNGAFWTLSEGANDGVRHVARSTDGCRTWAEMPIPRGKYSAGTALEVGDTYYIGSDDGVFVSKDAGRSWSLPYRAITRTSNADDLPDIAAGPDGSILAVTNYGVWQSSYEGESWQLLNLYNDGLNGPRVRQSFSLERLLACGGDMYCFFDNSVFRVDSSMRSWAQVFPDTVLGVLQLAADGSGILYVLYEQPMATGTRLIKTANGGRDWEDCTPDRLRIYSIAVADNGTVIAAADSGTTGFLNSRILRRSQAQNWTRIDTATVVTICTTHNRFYYVTANSELHRSVDGGVTFDARNLPWAISRFTPIVFDSTGGMLLYSDDGLMRSSDDGVSWTRIENGLSGIDIAPQLAIDKDGYGWLISSNVYRTDAPISSTNAVSLRLPGTVQPKLTHEFGKWVVTSTSNDAFSIAAYNSLGERIMSSTATGYFEISFDARGIYLIVVTSGNDRSVFKVIL
jgi:photosystem II stability/assembly factor-like uncharacterized protein